MLTRQLERRVQRPLLVFDEIDAGIGGQTARAVGEHLRQLAGARQILCITHLPQVAALAARHFTIAKDGSSLPAKTTVTALDSREVVGELVRMLGPARATRPPAGTPASCFDRPPEQGVWARPARARPPGRKPQK